MDQLPLLLGIGAGVVLVAVLAVRVSTRVGLPSLLIYLAIGVALGESGLGIRFDDAALTQALGIAALVLILADGGLSTRWTTVRPALGLGVALSTVAVAVSIGVTGLALWALLGLDLRVAFLWGAVLSSTDAAAVFSVLRNLGLGGRLVGALELESGLNDAPVFLAVVLLSSAATLTWLDPLLVVYELALGGLLGAALGRLGALGLRRAALPATGLYPLATLAVCVLAFASAQLLHASGLLATYVAALVLGNSTLPHREGTRSFAEGLGWLAQIGLFVLLGLFVSPDRLGDAVVPALIAGAVLTLAARPLSVLAASIGLRVPWREQAFLSWAGLRGAVPIVLALIPLTEGVAGAQALVDAVFVLVVVLVLVQGTTLPLVARVLGLAGGSRVEEIEVDAAPLDTLRADLLQMTVPVGSKMHGVYVRELRLPEGSGLSLVVRDGTSFTPQGASRIQEGDQLLVVTTETARAAAEDRLRSVDRSGRLARWRGDTGGTPSLRGPRRDASDGPDGTVRGGRAPNPPGGPPTGGSPDRGAGPGTMDP
ncbi:K+/H+ antiporter [Actinomycetospora sp. NBRC 106375]|uniref:potassium/proton antiporter n=1 Tax=Actinomycetospora sp. NBRC 106375 TaxID=3032207 RepID=UPI0024A2E2BC|nr:potassium/proton antiporter [Actinomycetospora sp. NBRC 106375]GLZ47360.1 K+/H+ antiporter [Actinomycetospora sp. NBRC 106375]